VLSPQRAHQRALHLDPGGDIGAIHSFCKAKAADRTRNETRKLKSVALGMRKLNRTVVGLSRPSTSLYRANRLSGIGAAGRRAARIRIGVAAAATRCAARSERA